ncbi:hypothetical protein FKW77_005214 [Venturia effusa]|uniref:SAP domain-containing protein n=1 Tax=Venturia effusa TaxID=50376 RepID=A0A517LK66_9PEZI|nr:hypothetical protein FKW77_005214 [Venturia effusa]
MTLPKRTLLEADPNAPRAPSQAKYLKRTNDGKENEEIVEWYTTLGTEDLRELCKVRGRLYGGNRVQLIEEGNPSVEEKDHQLLEKYRAWKEEFEQKRSETVAKLVVEGATGDLAQESVNRMAAEGHIESIKKDTYKRNYNDLHVDELFALCNILGLKHAGLKADMIASLQEYDHSLRVGSVEYKEAQKMHAMEGSPAVKRAIDIETASLTSKLCHERNVFEDIKARTLIQLEAKELATQQAKVQVDSIADLIEFTSPKDTLPNSDRIGAWLLASKIPAHGVTATSASTLHVGELRELLTLKNLSTDGTKPELIERLHGIEEAMNGSTPVAFEV